MDAIIVYMLLINSAVAVVAVLIAVSQKKFHSRVEERLSIAIADVQVAVLAQIDLKILDIKKTTTKEIKKTRTQLKTQVGDAHSSMEKGIEQTRVDVLKTVEDEVGKTREMIMEQIKDPKQVEAMMETIGHSVKGYLMAQSKAITNKLKRVKEEVIGDAEGEDIFGDVISDAFDSDLSWKDVWNRNKAGLKAWSKEDPQQTPKSDDNPQGEQNDNGGQPPGWTQEQQDLYDKAMDIILTDDQKEKLNPE